MIDIISDIGIVPVITMDDASIMPDVAKALIDGDLPVAEITFRTPAAKDCIKILSERFPEILTGAGTIYTKDQVDVAVEAGASFIVTPSLKPEIINHCASLNIPCIPGINSPDGLIAAMDMDLKVLKFFPAEASGGVDMLKSLSAIAPDIKFMPTGGISPSNFSSYINTENVFACGGSWIVSADNIRKKDYFAVKQFAKQAVLQAFGLEFSRLGITNVSDSEANKTLDDFSSLFGYSVILEAPYAYFFEKDFKIIKNNKYESKGQLSYYVKNMTRALGYFKRKNIGMIADTAMYNDKGCIKSVILDKEVAGFHIKLVLKP